MVETCASSRGGRAGREAQLIIELEDRSAWVEALAVGLLMSAERAHPTHPEKKGFYGFLHDFEHSSMADLEDEDEYPTDETKDNTNAGSCTNPITDPLKTQDASDIQEELKERTVSLQRPPTLWPC